MYGIINILNLNKKEHLSLDEMFFQNRIELLSGFGEPERLMVQHPTTRTTNAFIY